MKLVVGLGNPGDRYRGTRHNIGWEVLAELARRHAPDVKPESNFEADTLRIDVPSAKGRPVFETGPALLVSPLTYMNLSGRSVAAASRFHKITPSDVLLVCDDLNLPPGRLRLRGKGSAGGQNGLKDVIEKLGTPEFPRLRVGVGRPPGRMSAADYVLSRFTPEERTDLDLAVQDAADAVELWLTRGLQPAMNAANAPPPGVD